MMEEIEKEITGTNLDINIDYGNDPFYTEIWFLILIAALLLFLLVQLIRGGRRSRRKRKALEKESGISTEDPNESKIPEVSKEKSKISEVSVENETDHTGEED